MDSFFPASMSAPLLYESDCASRPSKKTKLGDHGDAQPMIALLAQPQDKDRLKSPLHTFVRKQIEVFAATESDLNQPAPGRKRPIQLQQIGLRCIHCKNIPSRERVKRAVAYPSSVNRLYHTVSDFSFAHMPLCGQVPEDVRSEFLTLKNEAQKGKVSEKKRSGKTKGLISTSTAKYYEESARSMGMIDSPHGIFLAASSSPVIHDIPLSCTGLTMDTTSGDSKAATQVKAAQSEVEVPVVAKPISQARLAPSHQINKNSDQASVFPMPLSSPTDSLHLNALHVFCRENIEIFAANEEDVASPAPGRKTRPKLGQIGLRCVHCGKLPQRDRAKRSVCYPPTISAIYHATSNMKFDHWSLCTGLPAEARAKFEILKSSCVRRGSSGNNSVSAATIKSSSSSTSQYYSKSARDKGLVDTESGIRYTIQLAKSTSNDASDGSRTSVGPKAGKSVCVFTGLSALALAACHAK